MLSENDSESQAERRAGLQLCQASDRRTAGTIIMTRMSPVTHAATTG